MNDNQSESKPETARTTPGEAGVGSDALLAVGDLQMVPESVCKCPECGGRLWWQVTTDDGLNDLTLDCENEPDIESDDEDFHRFWQSEWQPVIDRVKAWILSANAEVEARREKASESTTD